MQVNQGKNNSDEGLDRAGFRVLRDFFEGRDFGEILERFWREAWR